MSKKLLRLYSYYRKIEYPNYFQSDGYKTDKRNQNQIEESHSYYRLEKIRRIVSNRKQYKVKDVLKVLRDVSI